MQRQTRSVERSNSMRGKRSLDGGDGGVGVRDEQPERKRPALARYCFFGHSIDGFLLSDVVSIRQLI